MSQWIENTRCSYFNNLDDFWSEIKNTPPSGPSATSDAAVLFRGERTNGGVTGNECSDTKNLSAEELKNWLKCGWSEGYTRTQKAIKKISIPPVRTIKRRGVWSESGDELSQDRLFSGQLDTCWRTCRKAPGIGPPRIRLLVSNGGNCRLSGDDMFWRAAASMPIADALVSAGYHVAIDAVQHSQDTYNGRKHTVLCIRLKEYTQPLNPAYVVGVLGYVGFFRRLVFLWLYNGGSDLVTNSSLGQSKSFSESTNKVHEWLRNGEDSMVLFVPNEVKSEKIANEWLEQAVKIVEGKEPNPFTLAKTE